MKASQVDKRELELMTEEESLRQQLLRVLPDAAESGSSVFTNSEFNPSNLPAHLFFGHAESLLNSARECVRLRDALGLQVEGSVWSYLPRSLPRERQQRSSASWPTKVGFVSSSGIES